MRESIPTLIRQMNIGEKWKQKIENSQKRKKLSSFQKFKQYLNSTRAENLILWIYNGVQFFLGSDSRTLAGRSTVLAAGERRFRS
jgi:hypothetical protein